MGIVKGNHHLFCDWANDGNFTGTGEDLTTRIMGLEWSRGMDMASQILGRTVTGKLRAKLDNISGDYSSFNTGSAIVAAGGAILPGRPVKLQAGTGGGFPVTFPYVFPDTVQWSGFLQRITPRSRQSGAHVADLEAWGPLGYLNQREVRLAMFTSITTGDALGEVLNAAGWPSGDREITANPQTTISRFWLDAQKALNALRIVAETENGVLYETKDGKVGFLGRHDRLKTPFTTSNGTFSDATAATLAYSSIRQVDSLRQVINTFEAELQTYTVAPSPSVLWTHSETGASSPTLAPGESKSFLASFPQADSATDAWGVDVWTTPVENTDYEANTASDGSGVDKSADIGVVVSKFGNLMSITLTNTGGSLIYITLLQARGTPVTKDDLVTFSATDTASETAYGERSFRNPSRFIPNSAEAQDWCNFSLSIYKDPIPMLEVVIEASRGPALFSKALTLGVNDRVTIKADTNAGLGIDGEFIIEYEHHKVDPRTGRHIARWLLSPASAYSGFFVVGEAILGTTSRLAY